MAGHLVFLVVGEVIAALEPGTARWQREALRAQDRKHKLRGRGVDVTRKFR